MTEKRLVKMISDSKHNYQKRVLKSGDDFECTDAEADDLEALRMAHRVPVTQDPPAATPAGPAITGRALSADEPESGAARSGGARKYARRDLTAEK